MGHMQVDGTKAITMANVDIVATAGTICSSCNGSAAGSINGNAGNTSQVYAIVHLLIAINRMDADTEGTGESGVRAGCNPARVGRRCIRRCGTGGRNNGRMGCCPLSILGFLVILFRVGNFNGQLILFFFLLFQQKLIFHANGNQICQQLISFGALRLQNLIGSIQLYLTGFQSHLFQLQSVFNSSNFFRCQLHLLNTSLIGSSDLFDHLKAIQQIHKAISFEKHRPIRQTAILLHSANTLSILQLQLGKSCFRSIQRILLVGD